MLDKPGGSEPMPPGEPRPVDATRTGGPGGGEQAVIAVDPLPSVSEIPTAEFADPPAPTREVGTTAERPTDQFAPLAPSPELAPPDLAPTPAPSGWVPPSAGPALIGGRPGFDDGGPSGAPRTPASGAAAAAPPVAPPWGGASVGIDAARPWVASPWAPPTSQPGSDASSFRLPAGSGSDGRSERPQAWPPTPGGPPPVPPQVPGARGGFPPPLPGVPMQPDLPAPTARDVGEPAGPNPRPVTNGKVIVLVGLVSAVIAALVTSGIFLATGVKPGSKGTAASSGTSANRLAGNTLDIQALLAKAQPSVVAIHVKATTSRGTLGGAGTGVIISEDGLVLTNAHVIASADLDQMNVTLSDGSEKPAELVGSLVDNDIALIKIKDANGLVKAELGKSAETRVGDDVVAIGNALNLGGPPTVTEGIVSAKDRVIEGDNGNRFGHLIQTDAAINPGNSGGPLLNAQGQVIGINTAVIGSNGDTTVQNIGFAIAIDEIIPLIDQIKSGKGTVTPDQAFLGVQSRSVSEATAGEKDGFEITAESGAVVEGVTSNSAAADAGLRQGDVITAIDGQPVKTKEDVGEIIRSKKPGDQISISYERRGVSRNATAALKSRKDSGGG